MPSHPDRVRKNYEVDKKTIIYFGGVPIHTCDKVPKNQPVWMLTPGMTQCPFCFEKIDKKINA
jgi:hypothetical protein